MKGRKRIKAKTAAAAPAPQVGGRGAWILPWLGALALLLAWLAFLGGVSDGAADFRKMFEAESFRPWQIFRDLFLVEGFPASGWAQSGAHFYFPDYAVQWPLFALGVDPRVVVYFFVLAQVTLAASGWVYLSDFLFGKSPERRAAIWLLHALPLLALAYGRNDMFDTWTISVFHYGTWAVLPWLTGLLLRILDSPRPAPAPIGKIGALVALLAATAASDKIIIIWFVAPAAFAILCLALFRQTSGRRAGLLVGAMAGGIVLGEILADIPDFQEHFHAKDHYSFNSPAKILDNFVVLGGIFVDRFVTRNTPEFLVWSLFVAVALRRLISAVFALYGRQSAPFRLFQVARTPGHVFTAIFIPASAACCVIAPAMNTFFVVTPPFTTSASLRYFMPAMYFPLFVGYALLPSVLSAPAARALAAGALALTAALAAPKIFAIDAAALDPFNTPFQRCFAENAGRLGWTGVVANNGGLALEENPNAGVRQVLPIYFHDGGPGRSALATSWFVSNRHYFSGEFQFVMLNEYKGRAFHSFVPRDAGDLCALGDHECMWKPYFQGAINEERVRGAFGEPAEIVECEGVAFFHYDPPLHFDFSGIEIPHARIVGRPF